jgi:hypothetical protein
MKSTKNVAILTSLSAIIGIILGGFIFHTPVQTVEVEKLVQSSITLVEFKETVVEKQVIVKEYLKADNAQIIETKHPDGTVTIDSRYYGLSLNKDSMVSEYSSTTETNEASSAYKHQEKSTATNEHRWGIGGSIFINPTDPFAFNYKTDWTISISRRVGSSPFFATITGGPKLIGLGVSIEL